MYFVRINFCTPFPREDFGSNFCAPLLRENQCHAKFEDSKVTASKGMVTLSFAPKRPDVNIMNIVTKTNTTFHQKQGSAESCSSYESGWNPSRGSVGADCRVTQGPRPIRSSKEGIMQETLELHIQDVQTKKNEYYKFLIYTII